MMTNIEIRPNVGTKFVVMQSTEDGCTGWIEYVDSLQAAFEKAFSYNPGEELSVKCIGPSHYQLRRPFAIDCVTTSSVKENLEKYLTQRLPLSIKPVVTVTLSEVPNVLNIDVKTEN